MDAMFSPLDVTPVQDDFSELKRRLTGMARLILDYVNRNSSAARSLNTRNRATISRIKVFVHIHLYILS